MLEVILNGEQLCNAPYNDSTSKQHYSFPKSKRFVQSKPAFETEYNYEVTYDLAKPSIVQQELVEDKHAFKPPFNASSSRIQKLQTPVSPPPDTYNPRLLPKTKSCTFGFSREVNSQESSI